MRKRIIKTGLGFKTIRAIIIEDQDLPDISFKETADYRDVCKRLEGQRMYDTE